MQYAPTGDRSVYVILMSLQPFCLVPFSPQKNKKIAKKPEKSEMRAKV